MGTYSISKALSYEDLQALEVLGKQHGQKSQQYRQLFVRSLHAKCEQHSLSVFLMFS